MSLFVEVRVRLRIIDSRVTSQVCFGEVESGWLPVEAKLTRLAEALNHLSKIPAREDPNVYRTMQMRKLFGGPSDIRHRLIDSAIEKANLDQSELRIILEPVDDDSCLDTYNLPAEIWSLNQPSGHIAPDHPVPSVVRLVRQDRATPLPPIKEWSVAWMGGQGSIDTLLHVRNSFRGPRIKFAGAFPLLQPKDMREALEASDANIVWLVGHGDQKSSSFLLAKERKIGVAELCGIFQGIKSLRLLFINSCHIGNMSIRLAERLIREVGIPMVVTWETGDGVDEGLLLKDILPPFARKFFRNFRGGEPAETALANSWDHLFHKVYVQKGILNRKACPVAFKAMGAGEIQIGPDVPVRPKKTRKFKPDGRAHLDSLVQAYHFEESSQTDKAVEIYKRLRNCDDQAISRIAVIRLRRLSSISAAALPGSAS